MATTGVYAAYEPYASVSVDSADGSVEYTVNRFDQVIGARVDGREQPPDGRVPQFAHIDKAVAHTVRQETNEGETVSITVSSRSSGHAERLKAHIDGQFEQHADGHGAPPEVRIRPPKGDKPEDASADGQSAGQA